MNTITANETTSSNYEPKMGDIFKGNGDFYIVAKSNKDHNKCVLVSLSDGNIWSEQHCDSKQIKENGFKLFKGYLTLTTG